MLLEMLSTLSAGLFAGAAIYINLAEHPARMECGTEVAVSEFAPVKEAIPFGNYFQSFGSGFRFHCFPASSCGKPTLRTRLAKRGSERRFPQGAATLR